MTLLFYIQNIQTWSPVYLEDRGGGSLTSFPIVLVSIDSLSRVSELAKSLGDHARKVLWTAASAHLKSAAHPERRDNLVSEITQGNELYFRLKLHIV